ncbi:MAG: hypothetical protein R3F37_16930 [Candidatus Competibacteraceae bacterium]
MGEQPPPLPGISLLSQAIARVADYWRALGVVDEDQVRLLSRRAVQRAPHGLQETVLQDLTLRSLEEAQKMLNEWLATASPLSSHPRSALARVALCDGLVPDWPMQLATQSHSPETINTLAQIQLEPVPPLAELPMPEQRIALYPWPNPALLLGRLLRWLADTLKRRLKRVDKAK